MKKSNSINGSNWFKYGLYLGSTVLVIGLLMFVLGKFIEGYAKRDGDLSVAGVLESQKTIVDNIESDERETINRNLSKIERFSYFYEAITNSGYSSSLEGEGPLTIFAPTNTAMESMGSADMENLISGKDPVKLESFVGNYIFTGDFNSDKLINSQKITSVNGTTVVITKTNDFTKINNSTVSSPNLNSKNGVVIAIEQLIETE